MGRYGASERWVLAHLDLGLVAVEQEDEVALLLEVTAPPAPATSAGTERGTPDSILESPVLEMRP